MGSHIHPFFLSIPTCICIPTYVHCLDTFFIGVLFEISNLLEFEHIYHNKFQPRTARTIRPNAIRLYYCYHSIAFELIELIL